MQLFKRYGVPPASVIIEITEEQAFSHSEISMHNINQLRKFGLKSPLMISAPVMQTMNG